MKNLKKFENYMSREEMYSVLCGCGYSMNELENCSTQELEEMCRNAENSNSENSDSWSSKNMTQENISSREEMCQMLCSCGYTMEELEVCSDQELEEMCRVESEKSSGMNEAKKAVKKSEKWIKDAIKRPGALRAKMKKGEGEKISKSEISAELSKLKAKDKNPDKEGVQGLSKKDLTKFRQLNLAKTLKGLKEHQETDNYMFFANLENLQRMIDELLHMDKSQVDTILSDGHNWAADHIATSKDDVEEVYNFLMSHMEKPSHFDSMNQPQYDEPRHHETEHSDDYSSHEDDEESEMKGIKSFSDFKK